MRATVIGVVLSIMAVGSSSARTNLGITDCCAGPPRTNPNPTTRDAARTGMAPAHPSTIPRCANHAVSDNEPRQHRIRPPSICPHTWPLSAIVPLSGVSRSWGANWHTLTKPTASAECVDANTTIAATTPCTHTPTEDSSLPQNNPPKTGSMVNRNAPRRCCGTTVRSGSTMKFYGVVARQQFFQQLGQLRGFVG